MNEPHEAWNCQTETAAASAERGARIAGYLFLLAGIVGGCASAYITGRLYVPGDAISTAGQVRAGGGLVLIGAIVGLLQMAVFAVLAISHDTLHRQANKKASRAVLVLAASATAIMSLNQLVQAAAVLVATCSMGVGVFNGAAANALVLLLFDMHRYGFLIAQIVFGGWLLCWLFGTKIGPVSIYAIISIAPHSVRALAKGR